MAKMKESRLFGPVDKEVVIRFEKEIGRELPTDYRMFLLEHDGGATQLTKIILTQDPTVPEVDAEWTELMHFYSIHPNATEEYSLRDALDMLRKEFKEDDRFTPQNHDRFVPIGQDINGDLICLSAAPPDRGSVHFVDYEETRKLADSFDAFVDSLIEYRDIWQDRGG